MKLLTHNLLMCNVKACKTANTNYPLRIVAEDLQQVEKEFNPEFIKRMLPRLDWAGIVSAASDVRMESA